MRVGVVTFLDGREASQVDRPQESILLSDVEDGITVCIHGEPILHNGRAVRVDQLECGQRLHWNANHSRDVPFPETFIEGTAAQGERGKTNHVLNVLHLRTRIGHRA